MLAHPKSCGQPINSSVHFGVFGQNIRYQLRVPPEEQRRRVTKLGFFATQKHRPNVFDVEMFAPLRWVAIRMMADF